MEVFLILIIILLGIYIFKKDNNNVELLLQIQKLESLNSQLLKVTSETIPLTKHHNDLLAKNHEIVDLSIERDNIRKKYDELFSKQKSEQVRLGQISEKIIPFISSFPYDTDNIAALFMPIDLIVFSEMEIVFVEIKTGKAQLTQKQKQIKKLIDSKNVRFETHRLNNGQYTIDDEIIGEKNGNVG